MSKNMHNAIFTLFVGVSMTTVNMQNDILPLLCEYKMDELRNFKFSENLRPK